MGNQCRQGPPPGFFDGDRSPGSCSPATSAGAAAESLETTRPYRNDREAAHSFGTATSSAAVASKDGAEVQTKTKNALTSEETKARASHHAGNAYRQAADAFFFR